MFRRKIERSVLKWHGEIGTARMYLPGTLMSGESMRTSWLCTGMLSDREPAQTGRIPDHDEQAGSSAALFETSVESLYVLNLSPSNFALLDEGRAI